MNGKGSKPRPYNPATFSAGWDRVFAKPLTPPRYAMRQLSENSFVYERADGGLGRSRSEPRDIYAERVKTNSNQPNE